MYKKFGKRKMQTMTYCCLTNKVRIMYNRYISALCGGGEIGRRAGLRSLWVTPYEFKSRPPHQTGCCESNSPFFMTRLELLGARPSSKYACGIFVGSARAAKRNRFLRYARKLAPVEIACGCFVGHTIFTFFSLKNASTIFYVIPSEVEESA